MQGSVVVVPDSLCRKVRELEVDVELLSPALAALLLPEAVDSVAEAACKRRFTPRSFGAANANA